MAYPIKVRHLPPGRNCPNPWENIGPIGMTVHSTGTVELGRISDTDEFNESYFHKNNLQASAHLFADFDSITELLPWQKGKAVRAWHAGPHSARFISAELCEQQDKAKHMEAYRRIIWLVAEACRQYGWDPYEKITVNGQQLYRVHSHWDISCHCGGTDHKDPDHYLPMHGQSMDDVRRDVAAELKKMLLKEVINAMFTDMEGHWAKGVVEEVAQRKTPAGSPVLAGIAQGDGSFKFFPDAPLTRAQGAVLASRLLAIIDAK